jgi:hypothetical protein
VPALLSRNADVLWLPAAGMCFAGQRQRGEGNMPAGGEKTVSTLEKTKVRIEISKVLSVFPKVLTVFPRSGSVVAGGASADLYRSKFDSCRF